MLEQLNRVFFFSEETLAKHKIYIEKYEKNGEIYMRVTKYHINLRPKFVTLQYDNLFNGDPELGIYT